MDVERGPGDVERLSAHGWRVIAPLAVSVDPWAYRDYIRWARAASSR